VALPLQKLCEERAGRSRSQNEDPHGLGKTVPQEMRVAGRGRRRRFAARISRKRVAGRCPNQRRPGVILMGRETEPDSNAEDKGE
jgi:hypothetical protein